MNRYRADQAWLHAAPPRQVPQTLCYWPDNDCTCPRKQHIHHTVEDYERLEAQEIERLEAEKDQASDPTI